MIMPDLFGFIPPEWWPVIHGVGSVVALVMFVVYGVLVLTGVIKR